MILGRYPASDDTGYLGAPLGHPDPGDDVRGLTPADMLRQALADTTELVILIRTFWPSSHRAQLDAQVQVNQERLGLARPEGDTR